MKLILIIVFINVQTEDDHYYQSLRGCGQIEAEGTYCWGGNQEWYVDCIYHPRVWDFYSGAINWIKCPKGMSLRLTFVSLLPIGGGSRTIYQMTGEKDA